MVQEGVVSTPWQNDFYGLIMANLLERVKLRRSSSCEDTVEGCKDRRMRNPAQAKDPPTLPDPVLYTVQGC